MKLALYQGPSPAGNRDHALGEVEATLAAASAAGARMVVFPELFLPGYNHPDMPAEPAAPLTGVLARMAAAAGCGLVIGYAEAEGARRYNSALAIGPDGALLAAYRKVQLYGAREKRLFEPGDHIPTFRLGQHKAAILICYDIEFAPHVAALAAAGVTLILVPTANMLPFTHVAEVTVPAMSANHAVTIVYANYCGTEGDLTYAGGSVITGPDGAVIACAGRDQALLIAATDRVYDPALLSSQAADYRAVPVR